MKASRKFYHIHYNTLKEEFMFYTVQHSFLYPFSSVGRVKVLKSKGSMFDLG